MAVQRGEPPDRHVARFEDLKTSELKTAKAWAMKELPASPLGAHQQACRGSLPQLLIRSLKAMKLRRSNKLASTLADHRANILTHIDHRVTSAACEASTPSSRSSSIAAAASATARTSRPRSSSNSADSTSIPLYPQL
ncbi:MAG: transposase [Sandaracinaceae bacterium]|nr:transposase [Sandaracinaceae bacterium]